MPAGDSDLLGAGDAEGDESSSEVAAVSRLLLLPLTAWLLLLSSSAAAAGWVVGVVVVVVVCSVDAFSVLQLLAVASPPSSSASGLPLASLLTENKRWDAIVSPTPKVFCVSRQS